MSKPAKAYILVPAMQRGPEYIHSLLAPADGHGGSADALADAAVSVWRAVDAALSPVIGGRGVAALFQRSLHLVRRHNPSLEAACQGLRPLHDFTALRDILVRQTLAEISQVHAELLQTFCGLLDRLIGPSLTERLLQRVWAPSASGSTAHDTSP